MDKYDKVIMITGGAGFIGSHLVRHFVKKYPNYMIINYDVLTYAGNLYNLDDIADYPNYKFSKGDITDGNHIFNAIIKYGITDVIHLAAESHVDRSITDPDTFVKTNVFGTFTLLDTFKCAWDNYLDGHRFYHVSTDEVYGALDMNPYNKFTETTRYNPHSPYSASKASSDHFVRAYHDTFGMNTIISNCSNNYGPNQFPEKLIPLSISRLRKGEKIPIYGTGENVRDWLYVEDHCKAIDKIFHEGDAGETYNIGGNNEIKNIDIVKTIIDKYNEIKGTSLKFEDCIEYVTDRKGHDLRYAIDSLKLQKNLGWNPEETFETGIKKTVKWYLDNQEWIDKIENKTYESYYYIKYGRNED